VTPPIWIVAVEVPKAVGDFFADTLDKVAKTYSCFETADGDGWRFEAFFEAEPDRAALSSKLALASAAVGRVPPEVTVKRLPAIDWVAENRRRLSPIQVGQFFIHGSHFHHQVSAGRIVIQLDAGLAFGSGTHESTRGCLRAIGQLARRQKVARMLDLGTGSGILAIAMAKLWRAPVTAADIDPVAVAVARDNFRRNNVARLVRPIVSDGLRNRAFRCGRPYDLVVANILARPLERLAPDIANALARHGRAILSGILREQAGAVLAAYRTQGMIAERRIRVGDWTVLILKKP